MDNFFKKSLFFSQIMSVHAMDKLNNIVNKSNNTVDKSNNTVNKSKDTVDKNKSNSINVNKDNNINRNKINNNNEDIAIEQLENFFKIEEAISNIRNKDGFETKIGNLKNSNCEENQDSEENKYSEDNEECEEDEENEEEEEDSEDEEDEEDDYNKFCYYDENGNKINYLAYYKDKTNSRIFTISEKIKNGKEFKKNQKLLQEYLVTINKLSPKIENLNEEIKKEKNSYNEKKILIKENIEELNKCNKRLKDLINQDSSKKDMLKTALDKLNKEKWINNNNNFTKNFENFVQSLDDNKIKISKKNNNKNKKKSSNNNNNNNKQKNKLTYHDIFKNQEDDNIRNFNNIDQLRSFINNEIKEIEDINKLYCKNADKINNLNKEIFNNEQKINILEENLKKIKLDNNCYNYNSQFLPSNNFANIFDNIFNLDGINLNNVLTYIFSNLDYRFLINNDHFLSNKDSFFYRTLFVNQQEQILKYSKNYNVTNEMICFINKLNSFVYYTNSNFKGISDIDGTFHLCQFKNENINKFFFAYYYHFGYFYIKYNLLSNVIKFETTQNYTKDNLYNMEKVGIKVQRGKNKYEYNVYMKDDKFIYNIPVRLGHNIFDLCNMTLKYRKNYKIDEKIYKFDEIIKYLDLYTLLDIQAFQEHLLPINISTDLLKFFRTAPEKQQAGLKNIYQNVDNIELCNDLKLFDYKIKVIGCFITNVNTSEYEEYKNIYSLAFSGRYFNKEKLNIFIDIDKNKNIPISINFKSPDFTFFSYDFDDEYYPIYNYLPSEKKYKVFSVCSDSKMFKFINHDCINQGSPFLKIYCFLNYNRKYIKELKSYYEYITKKNKDINLYGSLLKNNKFILINNLKLRSTDSFFEKENPFYLDLIFYDILLHNTNFINYFDFNAFDNLNVEYIYYLCNLLDIDFLKDNPLKSIFDKLSMRGNRENKELKNLSMSLSQYSCIKTVFKNIEEYRKKLRNIDENKIKDNTINEIKIDDNNINKNIINDIDNKNDNYENKIS